MKIKMLRGLAIFLVLEVGLVHYFSSQHEFEASWVLGYLFIANFLSALVAAYGIYRRKGWGWWLGLCIALVSLVAYVWSRTTGLPFLPKEEWLYPWGVASIIAEGLFCLLVPLHFRWVKQAGAEPEPLVSSWRYVLPALGGIALILINLSVYRVDALYPDLDHAHVFFMWQVRLQPEVSHQTLEEEYGIQVSRAAVSAMDSIVDVRMRVLDREKAEPLLEEGHFALLVGDQLIQAPHVSRHMLVNKTVIVMFPNLKNIVKSGTPVSLVFENNLRVEPVIVN